MAKTKAEIEKILTDAGVSFDDMMAVGLVPSTACSHCKGSKIINNECYCQVDWETEHKLGVCYDYCHACRGTGKRK